MMPINQVIMLYTLKLHSVHVNYISIKLEKKLQTGKSRVTKKIHHKYS